METESALSSALEQSDGLFVRQVREWGEILTGLETRNKYELRNALGDLIGFAGEVAGGLGATLLRLWLRASRPFELQVTDASGHAFLRVTRPFRFIFHRAEIFDGQGRRCGAIQKRWSFFRRIYDVEDDRGAARLSLFGPILRPWTFEVRRGDAVVGLIQKKWGGVLRESFTDADTFGVQFSAPLDLAEKRVLVGAVFLIDFVHFENRE